MCGLSGTRTIRAIRKWCQPSPDTASLPLDTPPTCSRSSWLRPCKAPRWSSSRPLKTTARSAAPTALGAWARDRATACPTTPTSSPPKTRRSRLSRTHSRRRPKRKPRSNSRLRSFAQQCLANPSYSTECPNYPDTTTGGDGNAGNNTGGDNGNNTGNDNGNSGGTAGTPAPTASPSSK